MSVLKIPTNLMMCEMICLYENTCSWYDKKNEGEPCYEMFEKCTRVVSFEEQIKNEDELGFETMSDNFKDLRSDFNNMKAEYEELKRQHTLLKEERDKLKRKGN